MGLLLRWEEHSNIGSQNQEAILAWKLVRDRRILSNGHLDPEVEKAPSPIAALGSGT